MRFLNYISLIFRCTESKSIISITCKMRNDKWTVISLQLTNPFAAHLFSSLMVVSEGIVTVQSSCQGQVTPLSFGSQMGAFLVHFIATKHCHTILLFGNIFTCVTAWNRVFSMALREALSYETSHSSLIGVLASLQFVFSFKIT